VIKNALTLERVADALHGLVTGRRLIEAWTQERSVALLRFTARADEETDLVLQIDVGPDTGTILPRPDLKRQHRNSLDVFPELDDQVCHAVVKVDGDRIITFLFEDLRLHALLFSGGSGNVLVERDGSIIDALHSKKDVVGTVFTVDPKPLSLGRYLTDEQPFVDRPIIDVVRSSTESYVLQRDDDVLFSLIPLHGWDVIDRSTNIFAMIRKAVGLKRRENRERTLHRELERRLIKEINKHRKALEAMRSDAAQADHANRYRHQADLLLSYPWPHQKNLSSLELSDWDGTTTAISLNPAKTIVENAHALYAKAKRSEESARIRLQRIPVTEQQLEHAKQLLAELPSITDIKRLEALMNDFTPRGSEASLSAPYRVFELEDDYVLYVGKNAANNDQLTMKFAKQNDWWFHARGNSGSHCVLRGGDGKTKPPKRILEAAGAIAAYYSGARNASWTPVVYTQRKYVRKPKGANVGAVVLEREEVIMVKPGIPQ